MTENTSPPKAFSWLRVIHDSGMSGLTAMVASHSAPIFYDPAIPHIRLEIHKSMEVFAEQKGVASIREHLLAHFGQTLVLETLYGAAEMSPAMMSQERKIQKMKNSCGVVMADSFAVDLAKSLGARIIVESVQSLVRPRNSKA